MTFDNFDELDKISRAHPSAQLVLRILVENKGSIYKLGQKFGAPMDTISKLLARAQDLHLNVVGVSFHAGSGVADVDLYLGTFANAIERARKAFDLGKVAGYDFQLLDIGGGFQDKIFEQMATVCNLALNQHFPEWKRGGITVIAEPGQFFATNAFTLVTNIIARRDQSSKTHSMCEYFPRTLREDHLFLTIQYMSMMVYTDLLTVFGCRKYSPLLPQLEDHLWTEKTLNASRMNL